METLLPELRCNIILFIILFKANLGSKFQGIVPILFLASANIPGKLLPKATLASFMPPPTGGRMLGKETEKENPVLLFSLCFLQPFFPFYFSNQAYINLIPFVFQLREGIIFSYGPK